MSDSVSLENCDAWLVAVVVVFVIVISSRIASGRRAAGARRDEEGACALFCVAQAQPHARGLLRAFASRIYHGYRLSRGWGWVASGSLSRTSSGRMLASGSCYFRARTLTHRSTRRRVATKGSARSRLISAINNPLIRPTHHPPGGTAG